MKKDRNCGTPYPIYPPYPGMMPGLPMMQTPMMQTPMMQPTMNMSVTQNTVEQQLNTMEQRINSLENRVTTLENMMNNSNSVLYSNTKYNSSNYQMM